MVDFLKMNPYVTREAYMWEWTVPQILLASNDFTHIHYLPKRTKRGRNKRRGGVKNIDRPIDMLQSIPVPIIKEKKQ